MMPAKPVPQTPIIGTGGVSSGQDAVEMLMAGATVVGVGSAIYLRGADAIQMIRAELQAVDGEPMTISHIADLHDLRPQ